MKFDRREKHLIAQAVSFRLIQLTNPPVKKAFEDLYKKVAQWENEKEEEVWEQPDDYITKKYVPGSLYKAPIERDEK